MIDVRLMCLRRHRLHVLVELFVAVEVAIVDEAPSRKKRLDVGCSEINGNASRSEAGEGFFRDVPGDERVFKADAKPIPCEQSKLLRAQRMSGNTSAILVGVGDGFESVEVEVAR